MAKRPDRPRPRIHKPRSRPDRGVPYYPKGSSDIYDAFNAEIEAQNDRGAAILAGAMIEWRVKQAIEMTLRVWDREVEKLFGTDDKPGSLGHTDQCRFAYSLGLVGKVGLADLFRVAKIRNKFAHNIDITSFSHHKIVDNCKNLESPDELGRVVGMPGYYSELKDPRIRYITTTSLLQAMLWANCASKSPTWPKHDATDLFW